MVSGMRFKLSYMKVLCWLLILLPVCSYAESKKITIAFGESLPPWVIKGESGGLVMELLNDCLSPSGYTLTPVFRPYARRLSSYITEQLDAVSDIDEAVIKSANLQGYFSGYLYAYKNFAYSLSKNKFSISEISQLQGYSILSWQGAINQMGSEYQSMANANTRYSETDKQNLQVKMLFSERVDFIQIDEQIFNYYRGGLFGDKGAPDSLAVDKFALFDRSPNGVIFRSKEVRDACMNNLRNMDVLLAKYRGLPWVSNNIWTVGGEPSI